MWGCEMFTSGNIRSTSIPSTGAVKYPGNPVWLPSTGGFQG